MSEKNNAYMESLENLEQDIQAKIKDEPNTAEFEPTAKSLGIFTKQIPPREFLFYIDDAFGYKEGFLPSGATALLAAPGGCGKTYLLMQAAIAAACGCEWLNTKAERPIKVLFLAAEEDDNELYRRAQIIAHSMGIRENPKLLELAENNLRIFGRLGRNERLINEEGKPQDVFLKLKLFLEKNPDIKLVILDPATDYMSSDTEIDQAAAKEWVKLLSILTLLEGKPTILVAHHTRKENQGTIFKASEKDKIPDLNAESIRGAIALVNSFRWSMVLARREYDDDTERVFAKVVKTNYTSKSRTFVFEPNRRKSGMLEFKKVLSASSSSSSPATKSPILEIVENSSYIANLPHHDPQEADKDCFDMFN